MNRLQKTASVNGRALELSRKEYEILELLVAVEIGSERNWKRSELQSRLETYTDIIDVAGDSTAKIEDLLPDDIRITILTRDGTVTYDSYEPLTALDNHHERPEIQDALIDGDGYAIRQS